MMKKLLPAVLAAGLFGNYLFAQGLDTRASKNDWEEINFEFNSSVLTDGYPSLLRLSDLLKSHQDYKVKIVGNADYIGSNRYNDKLSLARANTVAQFLQKYGATPGQIQTAGEGKRNPEVPTRNKLGRWVNRRVVLTVTGPNGEVIFDGQKDGGGINDAIMALLKDINSKLDRLARLDDILKQLDDLKGQISAIKGDTGTIISTTNSIKGDTTDLVKRPPPLTYEQTQQIAKSAADYALTQAAIRNKKYTLIGLNVGPTFLPGRLGNFSASAYGRFLAPFGNGKTPDMPGTHAVQVDGEWLYTPGLSEGTFDVGLVNRWGPVQAGMFAQIMHDTFRNYQGGATLGEAVFTLDYIFHGGKIGMFGAKGFKDDGIVTSTRTLTVVPASGIIPNGNLPAAYIRIEDQIGFDGQVGIFGDAYLEASLAYKKHRARDAKDRPASMLRLVLPISNYFAITAEGDVNTTYQGLNDNGRVVFGIEFGNWLRPKGYASTQAPVPATLPRIHYEQLARP